MKISVIKTYIGNISDMLKELVAEEKITADEARLIGPEIVKALLEKESIELD